MSKRIYRVSGLTDRYESLAGALANALRELMDEEECLHLPEFLANPNEHRWITIMCSGEDGTITSQVTISQEQE